VRHVFLKTCEPHFVFLSSVRRLLVTASDAPSSPILVTLMKEELSSSETSVLTGDTRPNNITSSYVQTNHVPASCGLSNDVVAATVYVEWNCCELKRGQEAVWA
jgi:hypothetical protein